MNRQEELPEYTIRAEFSDWHELDDVYFFLIRVRNTYVNARRDKQGRDLLTVSAFGTTAREFAARYIEKHGGTITSNH